MATTRHVTRAARAVVTAAVFIFSILLSSSAQRQQGVTSSCDIPCVIGTGPTSLTCTFSVDVNETKSNFTVVRLGDGDSKGVGIVSCTWLKDQLSCTTAPGYEMSNTVTHHLVVRVPRASRDHSGSYACHMTGSKIESFEPCALIVMRGDNAGVIIGVTAGFVGIGFGIAIYIVRIYRPQCRSNVFNRANWSDEKDSAKRKPMLPKGEKSSTGNSMTPNEEKNVTTSEKDEDFSMKWVEAAFPDLDSRAYFLPPVYVNRVPMTRQSIAGQDVLVLEQASGRDKPAPTRSAASRRSARLPTVQDSDVRDDEAMQRIFMCLQTLSQKNDEVMVGISQLQFGQSKGYRTLSTVAALLPEPADLSPDQIQNMKEGDFDILLIHRHYGFVIFEVKSIGRYKMSEENLNELIRRKIRDAIKQLNNAEDILFRLVSDIVPKVRITKTISLPNLTGQQVQQALSGDHQLATDLCLCLRTTDSANITGLCLCSDQLSDHETPGNVSSHVLEELDKWWKRRVAGDGPDEHMTPDLYKTLVARFFGPGTIVTVPCTSAPRLSVKTLSQAVSYTGECYSAQITLFPEQVLLLNKSSPKQFVIGPPGTGKTVVLMLIAIQWLYSGHDVYIVSTWLGNRAVCMMLHHLLLNDLNTHRLADVSRGQPYLLLYDFDGKDVEKAVNDLSQAASGGSLYVIVDEVGLELGENNFQTFCDKLLTQVPGLNLWAASCFHGHAPAGWQVEHLTRPLRSPPAVVREYKPARSITKRGFVQPYRERGVPDHTDGPPVRRLYHRSQGQLGDWPGDCVTCGREVASFLHSLRVGVEENVTTTSATSGGSTPPCLQWRDVLVLYWFGANDNSGAVRALRGAGIPVRVMKNNDDDFKDVATASSDVVWVALGDQVRGLERKIVVCLDDNARLHCMSRCTSQLVIISAGDKLHEHESDFDTCHLS